MYTIITGVNGFIGSNLLVRLKNSEIITVSRKDPKNLALFRGKKEVSYRELQNHEVKLVHLATYFSKEQKDIEKIKLLEAEMVPVIAPKHQKYNLIMLKELPQIIVSSSRKEERSKVATAISHQFWHTTDFSMKEQLIKSGLGWGRLPRHQAEDHIKSGRLLEILDIPQVQAGKAPMFLLRSKTKIMGPNTKRLWEHLVKAGGKL